MKRLLIGAIGVTILLWLVIHQIFAHRRNSGTYYDDDDEWEMVGGNRLPQEPTALAVQDVKGKPRWIVSIPAHHEFPLRPKQYQDICRQTMELSRQLREEAKASNNIAKRMLNYYQKDQYYLDVQEAEEMSLLPQSKLEGRPKNFVDDELIVADKGATKGMKVCDKTLTYVMETSDAGFGNTLMRMWMAYGLAIKEGRTFFLDDTRW